MKCMPSVTLSLERSIGSHHRHIQQPREAVQEFQAACEPKGRCQRRGGVQRAVQVD